jgi:spore germination cell wall hydrolase CwlJ-like protein
MNLIQPIKILIVLIFLPVVLTFDQLTILPKPIEEPKVAKVVDPKQLTCMAKNIFYEAGSESLNGQAAVARVVMNRIAHGFGKDPCAVIYQASHVDKLIDDEMQKVKLCQFSWVCEGKGEPNKNSTKYKQAEQVAYDVLAHDAYTDVIPKSTLFFHNLSVDPLWPYKQVAKIGNHIFYSKAKKPAQKPIQKTIDKSENNI